MEQKYFMKYCPTCAKNKDDSFGMEYHVYGYINEAIFELEDNKCLMGHDTIQLSMTCDDYEILTHISTEPSFMDSMVKLHDSDIIEYNLKMSQFKAQLAQQESVKAQNDNIPKCPTCGSTKLSKVSVTSKAGSVFMFGLLSQKVKKTWHCDNCGYEW